MGLFGKDKDTRAIKSRNQGRLDNIKSLKKDIVKNQTIVEAIAHRLKTLAAHLPAMTVSPAQASYKVIGLVTASANSEADIHKKVTSTTEGWAAKESPAINERTHRAEAKAIHRLKVNASKIGANAVIGVNLDFEPQSRTTLSISAQGTAVIFDRPEEIFINKQIQNLEAIEKARQDYARTLHVIESLGDQIKAIEIELEK